MNWQNYWNTVAIKAKDRIEAVQRKDKNSTKNTALHIITTLKINKDDVVLDLCCGNGLLTELVSIECAEITGIDQSVNLINDAKQNNKSDNITYILGDVLQLTKHIDNKLFDKIYIQFSFQYFDKKGMGERLIVEATKLLKPKGKLFIGDIPDANKKFVFYDTLKKRLYYIQSKIRNKNPMGKFWKEKELTDICAKYSLKGKYLAQDNTLPYAWYRFDYLIEK